MFELTLLRTPKCGTANAPNGTARAAGGDGRLLARDTLEVTKFDRLVRSVPGARDIADEFTAEEIVLSLGGSEYDPTGLVGRLLFDALSMVAALESDPIRMRTRGGMDVARAKGRLHGKQPKLSALQGLPLEVTPPRSLTACGEQLRPHRPGPGQ